MENCLVTKLKGVVDNDNLPKFGKVIINFTKTAYTSPTQKFFVVGGGASKPCHVKLNNLSISSGEFAGLTEFNVPAIITKAFSVVSLDNDNMSMELSCYEISALQCFAPVSSIIGLDSIQYSSKAVRIMASTDARIYSAIENYKNIETILTYYSFGSVDRNTEFAARNKDTLKFFMGTINPEGIAGNTLIQKCSLAGDVINYPATIKSIYVDSNNATGSITALVAKFRAAGRTSGKIEANWLGATNNVTIDDGNGNEIGAKTYITNKGIAPVIANMYLTWTADSVDITKDGTGAEAYIDIYGANA